MQLSQNCSSANKEVPDGGHYPRVSAGVGSDNDKKTFRETFLKN
jgi:hypothetical protein